MQVNLLKQKLKNGGSAFGTWSILSSIEAAMVMRSSGLDFVIFDLEHPPTSLQYAQSQVFSLLGTKCTPILRLGKNSEPDTLRAVETGVQSIMVSHVSSAEEAARVVRSAKYYPDGDRGLSPFTVHHGYSDENMSSKLVAANEEQFIGVLVEGEEGIANLEEIVRVDGIDMIYVGIYDVSQSLGIPGDLMNPRVIKLLRDCVTLTEEADKIAGSVAVSKEYLSLMVDLKFRFVSYKNDSFVLREGLEKAKGWHDESLLNSLRK